jgi:hypothetical protein
MLLKADRKALKAHGTRYQESLYKTGEGSKKVPNPELFVTDEYLRMAVSQSMGYVANFLGCQYFMDSSVKDHLKDNMLLRPQKLHMLHPLRGSRITHFPMPVEIQ